MLMTYQLYGWTLQAYNAYNSRYFSGYDSDDDCYDQFNSDIENDEIQLLNYAELIYESNKESDVIEKKKELMTMETKYFELQIWDSDEETFNL